MTLSTREMIAWKHAYSQVFVSGYPGAWVRYQIDFGTPEELGVDELIAQLSSITEGKVTPLYCTIWKATDEPKATRWFLDVGLIPDLDVYPSALVNPSFAWAIIPWLIGGGLAGYTIYEKHSSNNGGTGGSADMISAMMPMMMMMMFMMMIPAMMPK